MKNYYKINVLKGPGGYSIMATSEDRLSPSEVLLALEKENCFVERTDVIYAVVDEIVSEYDIQHFPKRGIISI